VSRLAWLTPDFESGIQCRSLSIPTPLVDAVNGAIGKLMDEWEWEEFGDMTPAECAELAVAMWNSFVDGEDCMVGEVKYFANAALPANCLACDGASYLRVDYPLLYAALDSAFISDADHFVTPRVADRFIVTSGALSVGDTGGEAKHTLTLAEIPAHHHTESTCTIYPITSGEAAIVLHAEPNTGVTGDTGGGYAHNNMPPYICLRAGIVAK
jgi:microcystin-dependent protein